MKSVYATVNEIPEALRGEYDLRDGRYVLRIEGDLPGYIAADAYNTLKASEAEKRENNIKLLKALGADSLDAAIQRAALIQGLDPAKLAKLKDIDPDDYAALKATAAKLKAKGVNDPEDLEARLKAMLDAALAPVNEKLAASEQARAAAQEKADEALLRETIGAAYLKAGGRATALDFVIGEFKRDFHVVDNAVRPKGNLYSSEKPGQPMSHEEWLGTAVQKYDFAFEPSKGGGATSAGAGGGTAKQAHTGSFKTSSGAELKTDGISVLQ